MKRLLLLTLLLSLLAACTSGDDDRQASAPEIEGPALVIFYTDN